MVPSPQADNMVCEDMQRNQHGLPTLVPTWFVHVAFPCISTLHVCDVSSTLRMPCRRHGGWCLWSGEACTASTQRLYVAEHVVGPSMGMLDNIERSWTLILLALVCILRNN